MESLLELSREELAELIYWEWIIFGFGFLNAAAVLPQLWKLLQEKTTKGLSILMLFFFLAVQCAFTLHGYFLRDNALFYTIGLSACISIVTIVVALRLRAKGL